MTRLARVALVDVFASVVYGTVSLTGGCLQRPSAPPRGLYPFALTAASAKSCRIQTVELHPRMVEALVAARLGRAAPTDPVVEARIFPNCRTVDADFNAAGTPKVDASGGVIDAHALRTTFISWLAASRARPRMAQTPARHADISTTMERRTDLRLLDSREAVRKLPLPGAATTNGSAAESARPSDRTGRRCVEDD